MSKWQPIETAPRDGTIIDLWGRQKPHPMMLHVSIPFGRYTDCHWGMADVGAILHIKPAWMCGKLEIEDVTHWMPTPAPPKFPPQE